MPTEPHDLTSAEAVRRASEALDPNGGDETIARLAPTEPAVDTEYEGSPPPRVAAWPASEA